MIERTLQIKLLELTKKYPIVTLTGPRQSGKSTLLRHAFPDYKYVSLEDPDMRLFATDDPRGFLATYPDKTIISSSLTQVDDNKLFDFTLQVRIRI